MKADDRGTTPPMMVVFAGPNGSGKSTINREFLSNPNTGFKGEYINADDIAKTLEKEIPDYQARNIKAAQIAEERRIDALHNGRSFAFETVMSTPEKVALLTQAKERGYSVSLVFVTLDSAEKNVARVANRVELGGHAVEPGAIRQRYERAMDLLPSAVEHADKAIVFDNSGSRPVRVVAKDGERLQVAPNAPEWAKGSFLSTIEQRMASREQLQDTARAAGADRFMDAVAETGRTYSGGVVNVTKHHVLQQTDEKSFVAHDRALSAAQDFQRGSYATVAYAYDKGKIVSLDALRAQEQQAKAEAFRTADRQEVLKRFPTLANDYARLDTLSKAVESNLLSKEQQQAVLSRVRENIAASIERGESGRQTSNEQRQHQGAANRKSDRDLER